MNPGTIHHVRMRALVLTLSLFIEGRLTKEYGLDNTKSEKPLFEAEEFIKVIQYY